MAIIIIASMLGLVSVVRKWAWHTKFFVCDLFSTPISKILGSPLVCVCVERGGVVGGWWSLVI